MAGPCQSLFSKINRAFFAVPSLLMFCCPLAQNLKTQDEHGVEASMAVPDMALRLADRLREAANGWRFGTMEAFRMAAADKMALAFMLAAALATAAAEA
jgi:hypothetical protein